MKKILYLGCHCDDIELGCGGTINKYKNSFLQYCYIFSSKNPQGVDLKNTTTKALEFLGVKEIEFGNFQTRCFSKKRQEIWLKCAELQLKYQPDILFLNCGKDTHQDHKVVFNEANRKTFNCTMLSYSPYVKCDKNNYFEVLKEIDVESKLKSLSYYELYQNKKYFDAKLIESCLRVEGHKCNNEFAESFSIERIINV